MSKEVTAFVTRFNELVKESENLLSIVRGSELQEAACEALSQLLIDTTGEKRAAISHSDEEYANLLLGCECVAQALIAELRMWLLLKREKPDEAWDQLVTAQMASVAAARAHEGFLHLEQHNRRLEAIEQLVFPPQVFVSSGMIAKRQECSRCRQEYEDCEHLIGKAYMGEFCHIIARGLTLDHVAIVEHPADKRCRVQHFGVDSGNRNRMTWRIEPATNDT